MNLYLGSLLGPRCRSSIWLKVFSLEIDPYDINIFILRIDLFLGNIPQTRSLIWSRVMRSRIKGIKGKNNMCNEIAFADLEAQWLYFVFLKLFFRKQKQEFSRIISLKYPELCKLEGNNPKYRSAGPFKRACSCEMQVCLLPESYL